MKTVRCPECEITVVPRLDGKCPSCQAVIGECVAPSGEDVVRSAADETELLSVSCRPYGNRITLYRDRIAIKRKDKTISIGRVTSIGYFPGIPLLLCPLMTIVHKDDAGKEKKTRVVFHGVFPRLFTGFMKPGRCVKRLRELVAGRES